MDNNQNSSNNDNNNQSYNNDTSKMVELLEKNNKLLKVGNILKIIHVVIFTVLFSGMLIFGVLVFLFVSNKINQFEENVNSVVNHVKEIDVSKFNDTISLVHDKFEGLNVDAINKFFESTGDVFGDMSDFNDGVENTIGAVGEGLNSVGNSISSKFNELFSDTEYSEYSDDPEALENLLNYIPKNITETYSDNMPEDVPKDESTKIDYYPNDGIPVDGIPMDKLPEEIESENFLNDIPSQIKDYISFFGY